MTFAENKASQHYEARMMGHVEPQTKGQKAAVAVLVAEGKLEKMAESERYAVTAEHAAKLRADGYYVAPRTATA